MTGPLLLNGLDPLVMDSQCELRCSVGEVKGASGVAECEKMAVAGNAILTIGTIETLR